MIEVRQTVLFRRWFMTLRDKRAMAAIARRITRLQAENYGDTKYIGNGLSELRVDFGPCYRIYYHRRGNLLVFLLSGGDKSTQDRDIQKAKAMIPELEL